MRIEIAITVEPIDLRREWPADVTGRAGAVAEFIGLVRGEENGQPIAALEYEAYSRMAERTMREIAAEAGREHPCLWVCVTHRVGVVPVGEATIHVRVAAPRRAEAFALLTRFMTRLKEDAPIWKCRALSQSEYEARGRS